MIDSRYLSRPVAPMIEEDGAEYWHFVYTAFNLTRPYWLFVGGKELFARRIYGPTIMAHDGFELYTFCLRF